MKTSQATNINRSTSSHLTSWLQESLFTRSADSYFNPIIQSFIPGSGLSSKYQQAKVLEIQKHHANAVSLRIQTPRGWKGFIPGQYISCAFSINGVRRKRNYSISSPIDLYEQSGQITITVHRVEGGLVSNYLLDELRLETYFNISEAMGNFGLELTDAIQAQSIQTQPLVMLAAGSGITPFASILSSLISETQLQHREIHLFYSCAKKSEHLFHKSFSALESLNSNLHLHWHSTRDSTQESANSKRIDADLLIASCPNIKNAQVFICGSHDFTQNMISISHSLGVNENKIHFESFDSNLKIANNSQGSIQFTRSNKNITVNDANSILEQAELAGLNPKSGCRMGVCHTCTCTKTSGIVINRLTGEKSQADEEEIRICISQAIGEVKIAL